MNHFFNTVFRVLCETIFEGLFVLIIAYTASRLLRRSSAANRCLVWQTAAAVLILMPILSALLPYHSIPISVLPARAAIMLADPDPGTGISPAPPIVESSAPNGAGSSAAIAPTFAPTGGAVPSQEVSAQPPSTKPLNTTRLQDAKICMVVLWAGVAILLTIEAGFAQVRLRALSRQCMLMNEEPITGLTTDICNRLGIRKRITLLHMPHAMPMAWGWLVPVVLLPTESAEWPEQRLEMVLLHELAHIRRGDWPMQRFARLLCCLYWFHPLVWICLAEMKRAGEEACDDVVLSSGIPAPEYAAQLLEVIRIMKLNVPGRCNKGPVSVSMATAKPAQIQSRMRTILEPVRSRSGIRRSTLIAAGAIALCLAPLGAMHVFAQSTSPSTAQSGTGGATSYKHTEESHTASQANSTKPSSASQSAATKRLAAQLKRQAAQIAEQQREIQTLRKAVEMARVEAKTNAAMALKLKQADEQFYAANVRLQNEKSELDNETGKLNLQRRALSDAFATRGADTAEAKKELALRQAEIDDLMTNLVRSKALNSVGAVAASDLAAAKANIEHLQADLLKRQAELSRNAGAGAIVNLDTQKLRAELEAAMANLESLRAQYNGGAISKRELDTALAEKAKAKAELEKALDQLDRAKQEAEAAQKAAQDQTQKKPQ